MYGIDIPYPATFWIAGSRAGAFKIGASIVACLTNSSQNSAIYKLTSGPADWLTEHWTSIVLCAPNNASSSMIYKLTHKFCDIHIALNTADSLVLFPFSSSLVLSLCGYILSRLSMIAGSSIGGLTYLYLHLYNHTTNPTDHCCFPYLANFMPMVGGFAVSNSASCCVLHILHSKFS
jgi:hypothetical protein